MLLTAKDGASRDDWKRDGIWDRRAGDCRMEMAGALLATRRALTAAVRIILSTVEEGEWCIE